MTNVRDFEARTAAWLADLESGGPWWRVTTRWVPADLLEILPVTDLEYRISALDPNEAAREAARQFAAARDLTVAARPRREYARMDDGHAEFAYVVTLGELKSNQTYLVRGELHIWVRAGERGG